MTNTRAHLIGHTPPGGASSHDPLQDGMERADRLLRVVSRACDQLLTATDFREIIANALAGIGQALGVDRVALVEKIDQPGAPCLIRRSAWLKAADTCITAEGLEDEYPYFPRRAEWPALFAQGAPLAVSRATADATARAFLDENGLTSLLIIPIILAGTFWGFISLADYRAERSWAHRDVSLLSTLACMLGSTVVRQHMENALRATEESLRVSESRYLAIINNQTDLVCRYTPDLTLTFVNDAFCLFYRHTRDELVGNNLLALLPPAEHATFRQAIAQLTPEAPMNLSERHAGAPDGLGYWQQWSDRAIFDEAGQVLEYQSVGRDITARRYIEDQLREREERYRAIVANAAMGICLVDAYGQFLECNPALVQMTGYLPEELALLSLSQVTAPDDWAVEQQQFTPLWESDRTGYSLEKRIITRDGTPTWTRAMTTVIRDASGTPQYAVQLLEDISAHKEAEGIRSEYQEKLRALTLKATLTEERERRRIAQNLHDQIGQSLAIARLRLGQLCTRIDTTDPTVRQDIEEVRSLLSEALDYSRTVTCELSPPILHELGLVPALKWLARHFTERYHLPTSVEATFAPPSQGQGLRVVLYHIIRELLFNVVKHAQASRAVIYITQERDDLLLTVEDDGCGMTRTAVEADMEKFGLFSVRERVKQLGGAFTIHSSPGHGTLCTLRVPAQASEIAEGTSHESANHHS